MKPGTLYKTKWHFHEAHALPVIKKATGAPHSEHNIWEYAMHSELTPVFEQRKMRYSYVRLRSGDAVVLLCEKAFITGHGAGSAGIACHVFWDIASQRSFSVEIGRIAVLFEEIAI